VIGTTCCNLELWTTRLRYNKCCNKKCGSTTIEKFLFSPQCMVKLWKFLPKLVKSFETWETTETLLRIILDLFIIWFHALRNKIVYFDSLQTFPPIYFLTFIFTSRRSGLLVIHFRSESIYQLISNKNVFPKLFTFYSRRFGLLLIHFHLEIEMDSNWTCIRNNPKCLQTSKNSFRGLSH